jgi:2-(1,2-epoxy-1,2-dihydrophenyl)acetyl-CoA isomerase
VAEIKTGTQDLPAEVQDGVAVVTMNRPERRNAFSRHMMQALAEVLRDVELDDAVGAVVLTGAGGAFCAGGDVTVMADGGGLSGTSAVRALAGELANGLRLAPRCMKET